MDTRDSFEAQKLSRVSIVLTLQTRDYQGQELKVIAS